MAALCTRSTAEEGEFLRIFTNAHLAWTALKARHDIEKVGIGYMLPLWRTSLHYQYPTF